MGTRVRFGAGLAAVLASVLIAAAPASAGTVCTDGTTAVFQASDVVVAPCAGPSGAGEVNKLTVGVDASGNVTFTDSVPITDGGGCTVNGNTAVCPGTTSYRFDLGDGDDTAGVGSVAASGTSTGGAGNDKLAGGGAPDILTGGAGDDTVSGGSADDKVSGGDGNDVVSGGDGNDRLEGDPADGACLGSRGSDDVRGDAGDDTLCAGDGPASGADADVISGGDGADHVFYPRSQPVSVSLDGTTGDGEAGEGDNVMADVELVTGGAGADVLTGNDGPNMLDGAGGPDVLNGLGGPDLLIDSGGDAAADTFNGGDGSDVLGDAGAGPDSFNGGAGEDLLLAYAAHSTGVSVTLDGKGDDGAPGEGDNAAADIEDVTTGAGDDTIAGSDADNELDGGAGDDTLSGGGGNDGLHGGRGADVLDGGSGRDLLDGGAGGDTLRSRDGETDRDSCGGGTDTVHADGRDEITGDCEQEDIAPPAPVVIQSVVVTRAGFVVVRLTCPEVEQRCAGAVIVKTVRRIAHRFIKLGQANYQRLRSGDTRIVRARIAPADRRTLRRARRVKVRVVVTNVNANTGDSTSATKLARVTTRGL